MRALRITPLHSEGHLFGAVHDYGSQGAAMVHVSGCPEPHLIEYRTLMTAAYYLDVKNDNSVPLGSGGGCGSSGPYRIMGFSHPGEVLQGETECAPQPFLGPPKICTFVNSIPLEPKVDGRISWYPWTGQAGRTEYKGYNVGTATQDAQQPGTGWGDINWATAPVVSKLAVLAQPFDGCTSFTNAGVVAGAVAVVEPAGGCDFGTKALNAQNAGAVAVLVVAEKYDPSNNAKTVLGGMGSNGVSGVGRGDTVLSEQATSSGVCTVYAYSRTTLCVHPVCM